jgi:hypothetical protein
MTSTAVSSGVAEDRVFRGWWMVVVAVVGQCFGLSTVLVYTFGVFAKPLAGAFHATRGSIALGVSLPASRFRHRPSGGSWTALGRAR